AGAAGPAEEESPIPAEEEEFAIPPDEEVAIPTEPTELPALARSTAVEPLATVVAKPVAPIASKRPVAVPKPPIAVAKPPAAAARPPAAPAPPTTAQHLLDSASSWLTRVTAPRPPGREPLPPPPSLSELPILRLAPLEEDLGPRRPWPKRQLLIVAAVLGGLGLVAVAVAWLPRLEWLIRKAPAPAPVLTPRPQETAPPLPPELQLAAEQLPHLAPETIQPVAPSIDLGRPPDPPEVFRRADVAATRGVSALTEDEARELRSLKSSAVGALRPIDRARVR